MRNIRWRLAGWINDRSLDAKTDTASRALDWLYEKII